MPSKIRLFYYEPERDRWFPGDRYPRRLVRRVVRGRKFSGYRRRLESLRKGLRRIGAECEINNFKALQQNPDQAVGVLGKQDLLTRWQYSNPLLAGPSMLSHPLEQPDLFDKFNAKLYLVAGPWIHALFAKYWGERVAIWPIGIDTDLWCDSDAQKTVDFLIYEKFLWNRDADRRDLYLPIIDALNARGLTHRTLTCGHYNEDDYRQALRQSRQMIYLCEHETQGQAVLEAMASNVPVLAWDQGLWLDPVCLKLEGRPIAASSVPYFEPRCGMKFTSVREFAVTLDEFVTKEYSPRSFVMEHLTLEASARQYLAYLRRVQELA